MAALETRHVPVPEVDPGSPLIVRAASQGDPADRMSVMEGPGLGVIELEKLPRLAAPAAGRDIGTPPSIALRDRPADSSRDVPGGSFLWQSRRLNGPRPGGLRELSPAHLGVQDRDRASQDLPEVAIRDLMAHQGAQLLELRVRLVIGHELNAIAVKAQRLRPVFLGNWRGRRSRKC
jgi:hypothetical protein